MNKEKIDQTIEIICERIQLEVKNDPTVAADVVIPEWIKSLAVLIAARANLNMSVRMYESKGINQSHQRR